MTTENMSPVALTPEIERALVSGDVSGLTSEQRAQLYRQSMPVYEMAREHYEQLLKQQVEEDVPDHTPPIDQVA